MLGTQPSLTAAKQLYHLDLTGGHCELALPDAQLQGVVDYYWLLTIHAPSLALEVIPDTAVDLVLSPSLPEFAALYFPATARFSIALEGPIQYAGTCLHSARMRPLLGADADALSQLGIGTKRSATCASNRCSRRYKTAPHSAQMNCFAANTVRSGICTTTTPIASASLNA